jgi:high-affinity nickel permease
MSHFSLFALLPLGFMLGLRHGIDWDHIAAITDITGSVVVLDAPAAITLPPAPQRRKIRREIREGFFLATMYACGHALLVVVLGLMAVWIGAVLPAWVDPIMERIVGVTLVILGAWIVYSICRYGRSFQPQSRWMLIFSLMGHTWARLKSRITRLPLSHLHNMQYGPRAAFGIGLIHGIGAETGSQAVLLATAAGATTKFHASLLLLTFTIGLLVSNSLVAAFSLTGFVSAGTRRNVYSIVGAFTSVFSIFVGICFLMGQTGTLPDLQAALHHF